MIRRPGSTLLAMAAVVLTPLPAAAHGFSSVVYVDATSPGRGMVRTAIGLEYDLLVVSAADYGKDDPLFRQGTAALNAGDAAMQAAALEAHAGSIVRYVTDRFAVSAEGEACTPAKDGGFTIGARDGAPYTQLVLDYLCPETAMAHEVRSRLFPASEGYVRDSKTIVTYKIDLTSGSAALDAQHPSFSTRQSLGERFRTFFRLGAEHLLGGADHLLFLLALIVGSRRLGEIVASATTFTVAHSLTFILAALGLVHVPASFVEPVIALSIAVVAGLHLWRIRRRRSEGADIATAGQGRFGLDAAGRIRVAVVFCFGLVHGLGFADALGIDRAWSWTLLSSLFVFNVGIEVVQLGIIAAVFPPLALLHQRAPRVGFSTSGVVTALVCMAGLGWFIERSLQLF